MGTNAGRSGPINIGSGNSTANPEINIGAGGAGTSIRAGATINIGKLTTNPITIGNASANVIINSSSGSIKTGALTLTNPITLPTTAVTPTSAQLGYYTTGGVGFTTVTYTAAFPSGTSLGSISSIPIGRYLLLTSYAADTFTNIGTYFQLHANMTNGTCESMMGVSLGQTASTGGKTTGDANGFVTITATSGTLALLGRTEAIGTQVNVYITMRLIRIA